MQIEAALGGEDAVEVPRCVDRGDVHGNGRDLWRLALESNVEAPAVRIGSEVQRAIGVLIEAENV